MWSTFSVKSQVEFISSWFRLQAFFALQRCTALFYTFLVLFVMAGADDQVYDSTAFAQEEADYEAAIAVSTEEGTPQANCLCSPP